MKKIIANTLELIGIYGVSIIETTLGLLTPGKKGKLKRLEAKILRKQANNKLLPFGDKYKSCITIDGLLNKHFKLYCEIHNKQLKKENKEKTNIQKKENKTHSNRTLNIAGGVVKIVGLYALQCADASLTPGIKGKYKRNERKLFNTGLIYKLTPFGDKEYQEKKIDILEEKSRVYDKIESIDNGYIDNLSKKELLELRNKKLEEIKRLNKKEKQLRKRR